MFLSSKQRRWRARHSSGFTLIELLVVIAILGMVVGLLLPAVQAAREAARSAQCKNNLKQIGLGLHNFESARRVFPSGFHSRATVTNGPGLGPGWGWGAQILPFLEETTVRANLNLSITDPVHDTIRVTPLPAFLCPSDPVDDPVFSVLDDTGNELTKVAFANYVGVGGTFEVTDSPDTGTGVLFRNSSIRTKNIVDGLSHTIMVAERAHRQSPQTTWVGAVTDAGVPPIDPTYDVEGPPVLVLTNTGEAADERVPNNSFNHVEDSNSRHPHGVHILFCDGSVQSINNDIDPLVWEALGTRAGKDASGDY